MSQGIADIYPTHVIEGKHVENDGTGTMWSMTEVLAERDKQGRQGRRTVEAGVS